jgi:hypothetical protein
MIHPDRPVAVAHGGRCLEEHERNSQRPNSPQKLTRPGSGPAAEPPSAAQDARRHAACHRAPYMQAGGVPLRLWHVGPGRAA